VIKGISLNEINEYKDQEFISIKKNHENIINLIDKEKIYVNNLINKVEEKLNSEKKNILLTYDEIINVCKNHNYNFIKYNEETSPSIVIINIDKLVYNI